MFTRLLKSFDITLIQEAHGTPLQWKSLQDKYQTSHQILYSITDSVAMGGIGFAIKNHVIEKANGPSKVTHVIPGRAATATIEFSDGFIAMNNVHVHDLNKERTNLITQSFNLNIVRAQNHPLARSVTFTAGDFNFLSEGEKPIRVSTHQPIAIDKEKKDGKSQWWTTLMNKCTELHQPDPTRIGSVSLKNKDEKYLIASRIDRIYSS